MRAIILITSCNKDRENGRQAAAEDTWVKQWPGHVGHRFVVGDGALETHPDELVVDAQDDYYNVPTKNQKAWAWALDHQYNYVFQACVDTWINVPRLMTSGFERYHYSGRVVPGARYASGGCGYWLSAHAMFQLCLERPPLGYEDVWVGDVLEKAAIPLLNDPSYWAPDHPRPDNGIITAHLSKEGRYDPSWMWAMHSSEIINAQRESRNSVRKPAGTPLDDGAVQGAGPSSGNSM